ncbi:prepilin peptidase [Zavarzinia sp. CC-PAN008]|uniref:prepilin peptidase n=1 Tax=Zavarzinia sp. CC-PAN008 TaxID=3243332 RepID=UPI003F746D17
MIASGILVFVILVLLVAALHDVAYATIPNALVLVLIATFPVYALTATGFNWVNGLTFGGGTLVVTFILFAVRAFGGGDAKLLAASVLYCSTTQDFIAALLVMALAGGVFALFIWMARPWFLGLQLAMGAGFDRVRSAIGLGPGARTASAQRPVSYAVAIAAGVILVLGRRLALGTAA